MQQDRDANAPDTGGAEDDRRQPLPRTGEGAASALARLKEQVEQEAPREQDEQSGDNRPHDDDARE
ncbi:MAG TPA: hypothetical protein VIE63_07540 [Ramlibacter sp.]|jgi:hypothetical protein